ncbi:hypothetical protein E1B28_010687 [Marasmius oreades]|uniref:DUF6533 domain-containing protein n=1 Tax=Marasmius oreades TaxID=181124 RepID=A0A9P7URD8_9AGAR|nr:uncharacterized protein E1B28_010687 [Marasmius oreades]KAG7091667.1 hypothetical protein E1B28_010687 [Marasmius oreades]
MVEISPDVDVLETLKHEMLVRNFNAAAGALFAYDVLINLDVELKYIWAAMNIRKRPINTATVIFNLMYLAQRYLPLLDRVILDQYFMLGASNTRACFITYTLSAWSSILGILLSELILAVRIWAVWARKPSIGIILIVLSLGCSVPATFFFARFVGGIQYPELNIQTGPGSAQLRRCFYSMKNKDIYVCWIVLMVYDCASFILMSIPGFRAYRTGGSSNLLKVVYRDGVIYYAFIFLVSLVNVIIILILTPDLVHIISPFERVLHSILASHAVLHIRKVASRDYVQAGDVSSGITTTGELTTEYSQMSFASNMFRTDADEDQDQNVTEGA